jgi:hypothetical protein
MDTQGLAAQKAHFYNPQRDLITGGLLQAPGMHFAGTSPGRYVDTEYIAYRFASTQPSTEQDIAIYLHTAQAETVERWKTDLYALLARCAGCADEAFEHTRRWWRAFWGRSYILINSTRPEEHDPLWQAGRNYQLFRYMLGCNYAGVWPTKFNIQNQRLLYWPMLKSGDFAMLPQLFDFFNRLLDTARTRARHYFGVDGTHYPEQIGIYGLCPTCDHGWGNTTGLPVPQIRYHFSSQLEMENSRACT